MTAFVKHLLKHLLGPLQVINLVTKTMGTPAYISLQFSVPLNSWFCFSFSVTLECKTSRNPQRCEHVQTVALGTIQRATRAGENTQTHWLLLEKYTHFSVIQSKGKKGYRDSWPACLPIYLSVYLWNIWGIDTLALQFLYSCFWASA